jgi:hypothetical protein
VFGNVSDVDEILEVPIIRIVFAMAGKMPALRHARQQSQGNFTAYDIWASRLPENVFSIIGGNVNVWQALLGATHGWRQIYKSHDDLICWITETMTPMAGEDDSFGNGWSKKVDGNTNFYSLHSLRLFSFFPLIHSIS